MTPEGSPVAAEETSPEHEDVEERQQSVEEVSPEEMDEIDMANGDTSSHSANPDDSKSPKVLMDQERYLPIANVVRIMKTQMDPQAKLAKDAKECVQECVSEFISFIASEAAEICNQTKRKTITADDLLTAMEATGFDNYAEPMRIFLQKYRQAHKITGPIHRPHPNYNRPKQFRQDEPVRPLFFDTEQGRRCTETQYVINGSEIVKNAPLADEWNEQTGTLNSIIDGTFIDSHIDTIVDDGDEQDEIMDQDTLGAIALEQQGQMQIYVDPKSKQHYAAKETPNGMELYPLIIQDTPLQLENVAGPNHFVLNLTDGSTEHGTIPEEIRAISTSISTAAAASASASAPTTVINNQQQQQQQQQQSRRRPTTRKYQQENDENSDEEMMEIQEEDVEGDVVDDVEEEEERAAVPVPIAPRPTRIMPKRSPAKKKK